MPGSGTNNQPLTALLGQILNFEPLYLLKYWKNQNNYFCLLINSSPTYIL